MSGEGDDPQEVIGPSQVEESGQNTEGQGSDDDDGEGGTTIEDYGYPAPDEPHPIPTAAQLRKLDQVMQVTTPRGWIALVAICAAYLTQTNADEEE